MRRRLSLQLRRPREAALRAKCTQAGVFLFAKLWECALPARLRAGVLASLFLEQTLLLGKIHNALFMPTNVLGTELKCCCRNPVTGFYRDGFCRTGPEDVGQHTVCVEVTQEFLDYSVLDGNDLITPRPEFGFPGLKPGDKWCVCVTRWKSALDHNRAAPVDLEATHASALEFVTMEALKAYALK